MRFRNYEESRHNLDLNLPTISHQLCVLYPHRSGLVGEQHPNFTSQKAVDKFLQKALVWFTIPIIDLH